ncbi:alkaline phosphatase family protein [Arthrobacter sp. PM3]|uniref:alkaline phosphatase family protein n=1 Tax=Arthrobacter sp. PM3 TaxID=2017685 RepID=UPI000E10DDEC|nr:alkaline phosphatase family protein [Arthrobacter sp. PM3]AXJ10756.1 phosphodiesterase [Arthrobacter sp. PM3]
MPTRVARSRGLRVRDLGRLAAAWAASTAALIITGALLPGFSAASWWAYAAVAAAAGLVGLVLRPVLVEISARVGWAAVLLTALLGQALIMYTAIRLVPGIESTPWSAVAATWVSAAVGTLISWATTAGTDDGLVTSLAGRARRTETVPDPDIDGVLFVQLDGVPFPVLQWAVQSGAVPNIRRWLTSGEYTLREWTPQLPCTTPASQLGILHGTVDGIPAFRWYDRKLGRVLVANRPADARVIEDRHSTGRGLLCDDGVSISNLFTGDAPRSLMTMSRVEVRRGSTQTRRAFAWFFASPNGFMRSFTRTVGEILKERWQARRQVRRDLDPRVHRDWTFALLRAVTNGLLRDLNTALVAEEMRRGTKSIYADYVDYDEIAHHAGTFRPESLAALDGLDRTLGSLAGLAGTAPRRYRLVVLSDHGQSQGTPFADRYGQSLGDVCAGLIRERVQVVDASVEGLGRADSIAGDIAAGGMTGQLAVRADRVLTEAQQAPDSGGAEDPVVVLGSGNLGLVYVRGDRRWTLQALDSQWPALVPGLAAHPGVGFVAGVDDDGRSWAIGREGRVDLTSGAAEGSNPLAPFGPHAARVLGRALTHPEAPDLYVNSTVDPVIGDVSAFEGLVGSHGGLGGWQDRAVLLGPADLMAGLPDRIEGADELHRVLVGMLESCGQRTATPGPDRAAP